MDRLSSSPRRSSAEIMMEDLKKDFEYEGSRLMDEVNDFTCDVTKRIVVMRNLHDQMADLAHDMRMRNLRTMDDIVECGLEAVNLAFGGRYSRIGYWPGELEESGHWMERKR